MATVSVKRTALGFGCECSVYEVDELTVFKLYNTYSKTQVQRIIELNREYAARRLAPQVYSSIVKENGRFGYYTERIMPIVYHQLHNYTDLFEKLCDQLNININDSCELHRNWGLTKDNKPVLFDFGLITIEVLGLIEDGM